MNQSVSISLGGRVFYIEEDAYQKLKIYLEQIRISLKNETDKEEIVLDIEHRIAELFTEYLSISRQAINNQDVEKIISTMGNPENFAPESDDESIKPTEKLNESTKKSLFRDYDNKFIAGIIAGISKFIGIETLWLRLGLVFFMILSWWFFDESFILPLALVYIILWVLVPFAKTTSDKLRMEGKQINLDSIKEQFNISEDEKNEIKNTSQKIVNKTSDFLGDFLKIFGKILLVTLGIAFLISGFTLMFGFFLILNGFNSILGDPFNILGES